MRLTLANVQAVAKAQGYSVQRRYVRGRATPDGYTIFRLTPDCVGNPSTYVGHGYTLRGVVARITQDRRSREKALNSLL